MAGILDSRRGRKPSPDLHMLRRGDGFKRVLQVGD
jgi:hypothetical protein